MSRMFFNVAYTQLWRTASKSNRVCDVPAGSVLLFAEETSGAFTKVIYQSSVDYLGWVVTSLLDEIVNPMPQDIVVLPEQTHSLQDLKQYVKLFGGKTQFNLCGQICVAMLVQDTLMNLIDKLKISQPNIFQRVFPNSLSAPTGLPELIQMLKMYPDVNDICYLRTVFFDGNISRAVITPARMAKAIDAGWKILIGVSINQKGRLVAKGTQHWIVVTRVEPMDVLDGLVYFFNPASNGIQFKTWEEFYVSVGTPVGLMVKIKA